MIPRDEIIGDTAHGYLGLAEENVICPERLALTLPLPLQLETGEIITPQSAALIFPKGRKRHKLGFPPEVTEEIEVAQVDAPEFIVPVGDVTQSGLGVFEPSGNLEEIDMGMLLELLGDPEEDNCSSCLFDVS